MSGSPLARQPSTRGFDERREGLFRWFVGLSVDDPVWVPEVFCKNRDRLLAGDIAAAFLSAVLTLPQVETLMSAEHFSVDGTRIKAWASMKSFRRRDGGDEPPAPGRNGERHVRGEKRSNETHASTTDPDARLARKSRGGWRSWASPGTCSWRTGTGCWWIRD